MNEHVKELGEMSDKMTEVAVLFWALKLIESKGSEKALEEIKRRIAELNPSYASALEE